MKIGILTYHRSQNFGALFQAIATCTLLRRKGHQAYLIDYWPKYHRAMYAIFSPWAMWKRKLGAWAYIVDSLKNAESNRQKKHIYNQFIDKYILPLCSSGIDDYDVIIYGSDQIWRKQPYISCFNPVYFAKNKYHAKRHIAYAASMGLMNLSVEDKKELKMLLARFDKISVRERKLYDLVYTLGFPKVDQCLDPAILMTANQWNDVFGIYNYEDEDYLLYVNYIKDSFDEKAIREFACKKKLRFVKVNGSCIGQDSTDAIKNAGPLELFNLIRGAKYVFSSSFHAMIFAIIYHKPFYVAFANNFERASSLLNCLDLSEHLVTSSFVTFPDYIIDYSFVDKKLEILRKNSLDFLYSL